MIHLKTPAEIEIMKAGGKILSDVMEKTLARVKAGVTLSDLDDFAEKEIHARGAEPSFKRVPGYKWTICACVNDVVVHGIPTAYSIKPGDIVGIDCGVYYKDLHTDSAWTIRVPPSSWPTSAKATVGKQARMPAVALAKAGPGSATIRQPADAGQASMTNKGMSDEEIDQFLSTGICALEQGIARAMPGNRIYDISRAIQTVIEEKGYGIVRTLVGHGVGHQLHEEPEVPNYVRAVRLHSPKLVSGMTIAIEVIYAKGDPDVVYKNKDGWTIATKDGTLSALFEATVALNAHGFLLLTNMYGASGNR